jgi:membrane protein involved in colicin uptake
MIVAPTHELPALSINDSAKELVEMALNGAALVGKVENAEQNTIAVKAQVELKRLLSLFERERKRLKEPILEAGRAVDRFVSAQIVEIEKEEGRIKNLTSQFQLAEARRVAEEQRKQQEELQRIERERQAELARIAAEQARIEREARAAAAASQRLADEAKSKKQREAAAAAQAEAARKAAEAQAAAAASLAAANAVETKAAEQYYIESRPIQATRVAGQTVKTDWEIEVVNPYELARLHPDCVKIEPLMTPIKAALNQGRTVAGITANKVTVANVRTGRQTLAIDV